MIEFKNLYFTYEKEFVLNDINLRIEPGQYVALIGDNGAGKSTLLRLLIGDLKTSRGQMTISKEFNRIGYVPQNTLNRQLNFPATVLEIVVGNLYQDIGLFRLATNKHRQQAMEALALVNMLDYKDELISNLSGGQQQRVMLARALVNKPNLVILDEPTSGVDRKSSKHFYETLSLLNKEGLTILLVTHNVDHLVKEVTDIYELDEGHLERVK